MQGLYRTILVPLDGSSFSERALPTATALARATGAGLVLVRAASASVPPGGIRPTYRAGRFKKKTFTSPPTSGAPAFRRHRSGRSRRQSFTWTASPTAWPNKACGRAAVPYAAAAEGILTEIDVQSADLVVMCTHGRSGLGRWIFGSVAEEVLAHSPVPVLLVRPTGTPVTLSAEPGKFRLLVPLDGSAFAEAALPHAAKLAQALADRSCWCPRSPHPSARTTT